MNQLNSLNPFRIFENNYVLFSTWVLINMLFHFTHGELLIFKICLIFLLIILSNLPQNIWITVFCGLIGIIDINWLFADYLKLDAISTGKMYLVNVLLINITILFSIIFLALQVQQSNKAKEILFTLEQNALTLAHTDALTGIPNRLKYEIDCEIAFKNIDINNSIPQLALMLFDLDNFKRVNDTLGHNSGDLLLKEVASRLQRHTNDKVSVYRLGGDEFVMIIHLDKNLDIKETTRWLEFFSKQILNNLIKGITLEGKDAESDCNVSSSVGIAVSPTHGTNLLTLYEQSDMALYVAKASGKNCAIIYDNG